MSVKYVITDIEGTTTDIRFVHNVLFPFARKHLAQFVEQHQDKPEIAAVIAEVKAGLGDNANLNDVINQLIEWIDQDKKITPLKTLQGFIWQQGYESGELKSHIYDDVVPMLELWRDQDITLGIYSSGSVGAQKLLFKYTQKGDLTPMFSHYFDTNIGHKREADSYHNIAELMNAEPAQVLFLSDVVEELDAAKAAGMQTVQLHRDGQPTGTHPIASGFSHISFTQE